jgi:AraC family transcriptional regulator
VADDIVVGDPVNLEIIPRFCADDPLIEQLFLGVRDALCDDDSGAVPYVDYLGRAIAARLIRHHSSVSVMRPRRRITEPMANHRLSRALEFIEASLAKSVGLPAMADAAGLSTSHFVRQFRTSMGTAPHQYLVQRRVELAKRRLEATDASIAEVAFGCGFANQEHLRCNPRGLSKGSPRIDLPGRRPP